MTVMDNGVQKAKMFISITFGIVIVLILAIAGLIIGFVNRPLHSSVAVAGIQTATQVQPNSVLAKADDCYYEVDASDEFAALFQFENWELVSKVSAGEPVISLQFAELWVVNFYTDGLVAAHNGYAPSRNYKGSAYYSIPLEVSKEIIAYLEQNGTPHELGDGTISKRTFCYE